MLDDRVKQAACGVQVKHAGFLALSAVAAGGVSVRTPDSAPQDNKTDSAARSMDGRAGKPCRILSDWSPASGEPLVDAAFPGDFCRCVGAPLYGAPISTPNQVQEAASR